MTNEEWKEQMQANQLAISWAQRELAEGMVKLQAVQLHMAETCDKFMEATNARLERTEANLDLLIAGILREHKNGGSK